MDRRWEGDASGAGAQELNVGGQRCQGSQAKRTAGAKSWRFEAVCSGLKVDLMVQGAERVVRDETAKEAGWAPRNSLKSWVKLWGQ